MSVVMAAKVAMVAVAAQALTAAPLLVAVAAQALTAAPLLVAAPGCSKRHGDASGARGAEGGASDPAPRRASAHRRAREPGPAVPPRDRVAARVLFFTASWCPSCHQLKKEVLEDVAGRRLLSGLPQRTVDFDAPANQALVMRRLVTGLPTTIFLRQDGSEIDRIVGYDGRRAFLEEVRAILAGRDGLHLLRDQLRRRPDDLKLHFQAGYKLLLRGKAKAAAKHYDHILARDPTDKTGLASRVMMHRGRYLVRCKRDYPAAVKLLRRAVRLYGAGRAGKGLRYWLGWALCKAGQPAAAARSLDAWVKKKQRAVDALVLAAGLRRKCGHELEQALALAREAVEKEPKNDWGWYLVADLSHRLGHPRAAKQAIAKAVALDPDLAFYRNEQRRLGGSQ